MEEADYVLTSQVLNISRGWDLTREMFSIAWWEFSLLRFVLTFLHPFVTCPYILQGTAGFPSSSAEQCALPRPHWILLSGGLSQVYPSSWAFGIALVLLPKISVWT